MVKRYAERKLLMRAAAASALALSVGCGSPASEPVRQPQSVAKPPSELTISVLSTNDVHGHIERLPLLAGYVDRIRQARRTDGGDVLLVDAGDLFQGTLASNLAEGSPVIEAFHAMGYDVATIGNHEFDFGPTGPRATPSEPTDDARGALKDRLKQARFPFVAANLQQAGEAVAWPNVSAVTVIEKSDVRIGVIGLITAETPSIVMAANFRGLDVAPLAESVAREAQSLRSRCDAIIVLAHAGGKCSDFSNPDDVTSCTADSEVFELARALPTNSVDLIVGGHSHAGVAHRVNGVPIVEAYSNGRAFGRVDLRFSLPEKQLQEARLFAPQPVCPTIDDSACTTGRYDGEEVRPSARVGDAVRPALAQAAAKRNEPLGVTLPARFERSYDAPSTAGHLVADLMRTAAGTDVAITNGGGLRAHLPSGAVTFGDVFELMPFDNRLVTFELSAGKLAQLLKIHAASGKHGLVSISGFTAKVRCQDGFIQTRLSDPRGEPIDDDRLLTVATSDFLSGGGDGFFVGVDMPRANLRDAGKLVRDALVHGIQQLAAAPDARKPEFTTPRLVLESKRPMRCN